MDETNKNDFRSVSFEEEQIWILDNLAPGNPSYNTSRRYMFSGPLDIPVLQRAVNEVVRRHESLRAIYLPMEGRPSKRILPELSIPIKEVDVPAEIPAPERDAWAVDYGARNSVRPYNLKTGPLMRILLVRIADDRHEFLLEMHHICMDGWSQGIFMAELFKLYDAFKRDQPSPLPELTVQYSDYVVEQQSQEHQAAVDTGLEYFEKMLDGAPSETTFPFDRPRPRDKSHEGKVFYYELESDLADAIIAMGRQNNATLFVTLVAAVHVLLHRYNHQDNIVTGFPVAARDLECSDGIIGFFANTLPLRSNLSNNPTFVDVLAQVREGITSAFSHRVVPLARLVQQIDAHRDLRSSPVFQVVVNNLRHPTVLEEMYDLSGAEPRYTFEDGLTVRGLNDDGRHAAFDLGVMIVRTESNVTIRFQYDTDIYDDATVHRIAKHLLTLLEVIEDDPMTRVSELPLLAPEERQQILVDWNDTKTEYPEDQCVHHILEERVAKKPETVAVVDDDGEITYGELNAHANQLARHLQEIGVKPGDLIAICAKRSIDVIIGFAAILKTGSAYVPLEMDQPDERLASILENCKPSVLLTQTHLAHRFASNGSKIVCLDDLGPGVAEQSDANIPSSNDIDSLAYITYTSGSTGVPQGVCIPHRGVNSLLINTDYIHLSEHDVFAQICSIAFDVATLEIWGTLLHGGRLVIVSKDTVLSPPMLEEAITQHGINTLNMTPALFNQIARIAPETFQKLDYLIVGGDAIAPRRVKEVLDACPSVKMFNAYGPTESTTNTTVYPIKHVAEDAVSLPIGPPIANREVYVLDDRLNPVPIGVAGELYIGGPGLARGYLNNPERTKERFIPHPFSSVPGERLYRSGDMVKFLPDGNLEFIGRRDFQVKLRGYRIELTEIEIVLEKALGVRQAAVLLVENESIGKQLVGYVEADTSGTSSHTLNAFLSEKLPAHMVPSNFVILEKLPLNTSRKIDRKALAGLEVKHAVPTTNFVEPSTETECAIASFWSEQLPVDIICVETNFFEMGGHSLLAIELMTSIEDTLNLGLSVRDLFENPTVRGLAEIADSTHAPNKGNGEATESKYIEMLRPGSNKKPFFCATGAGSVTGYYTPLASHLSPGQPFYGLKDPSFDKESTVAYPTVEELARRFVKAIRTIQPHGPYRVGGWSFGGIVAFEIAQQFVQAGEEVEMLIILDSMLPVKQQNTPSQPNPTQQSIGVRILRISRAMMIAWPLVCGYIRDTLKVTIRRATNNQEPQTEKIRAAEYFAWARHDLQRQAALKKAGLAKFRFKESRLMMIEDPFVRLVFRTMKSRAQAVRSYKVESYPNGITLICGDKWNRDTHPKLGWDGAVQGPIEIHSVAGSHEAFLEEPYVIDVAKKLQSCLDGAP